MSKINSQRMRENKVETVNSFYLSLLHKDSMILSCIDALDFLSLDDWQRVQAMYDEETGQPDGEEYGV